MKYVTCMGGIYKLTNKQYRDALQSVAKTGEYELPERKCIGDITCNITDMKKEEAIDLLEFLDK